MWPFHSPDEVFRKAVEREFGALAEECGARLQTVSPMVFGFRTQHAVLTIGVYPGHFRRTCVKLRPSGKDERVTVLDGADIGLANIEQFVTGNVSSIYSERNTWSAEPILKEVKALAAKVREVAMPFLVSPAADWDGVRDMIAARVSRVLEERPYLQKYGKRA